MSIFNYSKIARTKYSTFNMSHDVKLSGEMGQLIPFFCEEVLPGDKWKLSSEILVRAAPNLAPIMHRVDVRVEYFFVPCRILTPAWEKVMFPKPNIAPSVSLPRINFEDLDHLRESVEATLEEEFRFYSWKKRFSGVADQRVVSLFGASSLADYLGVTTALDGYAESGDSINVLPMLAYQRIYNDYYRDPNLHPDLQDMQDGQYFFSQSGVDPAEGFGFSDRNNLFDLEGNLSNWDSETDLGDLRAANIIQELFAIRNRCWEKDYFTSALPWRQGGAPAVAPIQFNSDGKSFGYGTGGTIVSTSGNSKLYTENTSGRLVELNSEGSAKYLNIDNSSSLGLSIADLQTASWLQRFLENIGLGGHRMIEQILAHFGVRVPDYRVDRAEFLAGNRTPLTVSPIYQTSSSVEGSPLANPSGQSKSVGVNRCVTRSFEEHGFLMGIVSIMPRTTYSQGLHRKFSRFDRLDYAWPEFAMLGEQEVKNKELFFYDDGHNDDTFGYQQRYAEYKYINSTVHGDFADTLDFWHMGREFANRPNLNASFVESNPTDRIWSVPSATNHIWMMIHNNVLANRPLPQVSNSSLA